MNTLTSAAVAVLSAYSVTTGPVARADNSTHQLAMTPMHGISFDLGSKRAVAYYLSAAGQCRLVLTLADAGWRDEPGFTTTRFEATLAAEHDVRFVSVEGRAVEFVCGASARTMTAKLAEQIAARAARP